MGDKWHEGVTGYNSLYGFFSFYFRVIYIRYYERKRIDTRKGSEVWGSKHHWILIGKEIIAKAMHEARSKDELYRKIYHEPEGNIGVLRVKSMHSPLFLFSRHLHVLLWEKNNMYKSWPRMVWKRRRACWIWVRIIRMDLKIRMANYTHPILFLFFEMNL